MDDTDSGLSPADDGLPEIADDDSYADDVHEALHEAERGFAGPPDREDGPLGLDEYGTTAYERVHREPLDQRLAREVPDASLASDLGAPDPRLARDVDQDANGQLVEDSLNLDDDPIDPRLDSAVSVYDRPIPGVPDLRTVGRLIRDGGGYVSTETDEVASDVGRAGGGWGGEELAMHEMRPEEVDLEAEESDSEPYVTAREPEVRTGAEQPWDPEDLAVAEGHDPTPEAIERARRELERLGPAAIEKTVP